MSDEQNKPEWLESVSVLSLKPGDVIVLKSNRPLSAETVERIREHWKRAGVDLGVGQHKLLVLEDGMDVGVLRPE